MYFAYYVCNADGIVDMKKKLMMINLLPNTMFPLKTIPYSFDARCCVKISQWGISSLYYFFDVDTLSVVRVEFILTQLIR